MKTGELYWTDILEILQRWLSLGMREGVTGATLIGHVPHWAPDGWMHEYYVPLLEQEIAILQTELGVKFPLALRELFAITNGLNLFLDSLAVFGIRENYDRRPDFARQPYDIIRANYTSERPDDAKSGIVIIGSYSWDGSRLYFDETSDHLDYIYRCERWSVVPLNRWDNFWEMLYGETKRLAELFDEQGRKIDPERPTTPEPTIAGSR